MKSAVINFKTDPLIKAAAQARAKKMGLSLSDVLYGQLSAFAQGGAVRIDFPAEAITPKLERLIAEVRAEAARGGVSPAFDSADTEGMRRWLEADDDD